MSFVGTRPEVVKYVKKYKPEYFATLLLPAGITSEASIKYKDEAELLDAAEDVDEVYITKVLPEKMKYNLSIGAFFRKPSAFMHIIKAFLKPGEAKRKERYVELASIGVDPKGDNLCCDSGS